MADVADFDPSADILPDELLNKHLAGGVLTDEDSPELATDGDESPEDADDTTASEDEEIEEAAEDADETEDTDPDDPDGDEDEPDDELEGEDEDPDGAEDEEDPESEEDEEVDPDADVLDNEEITAEDRERIAKDPSLRRIHKEMQRGLTEKATEISRERREISAREARVDQFERTLATAEGLQGYLGRLLQARPDIVGSAFEAVASGDAGYDFLVEVGLHDADMLEKAYERVQELRGDEASMRLHVDKRDTKAREADLVRREEGLRRQRFDGDLSRLETALEKEAKRLGIEEDDMEQLWADFKTKVVAGRQKDGSIKLERSDITALTKTARERADRLLERARLRLKKGKTKVVARKPGTPVPKKPAAKPTGAKPTRSAPRPTARPRPKVSKFKPREGMDPLDDFVDRRLEQVG